MLRKPGNGTIHSTCIDIKIAQMAS